MTQHSECRTVRLTKGEALLTKLAATKRKTVNPQKLASTVGRALIPTSSASGAGWKERVFADTGWLAGKTAVGYERTSGYQALIQLNVPQMYNTNTSCYLRIPFTVGDPAVLNSLVLRMKYDDGYAAYLNGGLVAQSSNAPAALTWNAAATAGHDDTAAVVYEDVDLSNDLGRLVPGTNVLAIHAFNDSVTSSDFLVLPELVATRPPPPAFPPFAEWVAGFALADPSPGADPDGDGATNQDEYVYDTHPGQADRMLRAVHIAAPPPNGVTLTFRAVGHGHTGLISRATWPFGTPPEIHGGRRRLRPPSPGPMTAQPPVDRLAPECAASTASSLCCSHESQDSGGQGCQKVDESDFGIFGGSWTRRETRLSYGSRPRIGRQGLGRSFYLSSAGTFGYTPAMARSFSILVRAGFTAALTVVSALVGAVRAKLPQKVSHEWTAADGP